MKKSQVHWACRRGMLELDFFLIPFVRDCFDHLSCDEQQDFYELLKSSDPSLYGFLMNQSEPENAAFKALITKIRHHAKTVNRNS